MLIEKTLSTACRKFTKIDHILCHIQVSANFKEWKLYRIDDLTTMIFKPEINNKKITVESSCIWKLGNTLLNNLWVKDNITGKKNFFELLKHDI